MRSPLPLLYFQIASQFELWALRNSCMDHPCEKCAHPVEDGVPFCPHCRAPQIRVVVLNADGTEPVSDSEMPVSRQAPNTIQWSLALPVCAAAGILCGFVMAVTDESALLMLPAGFLAVVFYRRRQASIRVSGRIGARLGGAVGVVAMAVFFAATVYNGHLRDLFAQTVNLYISLESDANVKEFAQRSLEMLKQPSGFSAWVVSICLRMFTFFVAGGALGGAIVGRRGPR